MSEEKDYIQIIEETTDLLNCLIKMRLGETDNIDISTLVSCHTFLLYKGHIGILNIEHERIDFESAINFFKKEINTLIETYYKDFDECQKGYIDSIIKTSEDSLRFASRLQKPYVTESHQLSKI